MPQSVWRRFKSRQGHCHWGPPSFQPSGHPGWGQSGRDVKLTTAGRVTWLPRPPDAFRSPVCFAHSPLCVLRQYDADHLPGCRLPELLSVSHVTLCRGSDRRLEKVLCEQLHNFHSSPNIINVIISVMTHCYTVRTLFIILFRKWGHFTVFWILIAVFVNARLQIIMSW
jgi:hypothetical protein